MMIFLWSVLEIDPVKQSLHNPTIRGCARPVLHLALAILLGVSRLCIQRHGRHFARFSPLKIWDNQRNRNKEWGLFCMLFLLSLLFINWTDGIRSDLLFDTRSFRKAILASLLSVPIHYENKSSEEQSLWINSTKEAYIIQVNKLCILQAPISISNLQTYGALS